MRTIKYELQNDNLTKITFTSNASDEANLKLLNSYIDRGYKVVHVVYGIRLHKLDSFYWFWIGIVGATVINSVIEVILRK